MGKYNQGILGAFSGKVGTVIGSSWKGISYMRSLARPGSRKTSDLQQIQREKFTIASGFLKPISSLLNIGFKNEANGVTPFNVATSWFLKNAIAGVYPDLQIDFSKVLFSRGPLSIPANVQLSSVETGKLQLVWTNNSAAGIAAETDKAIILVMNPDKEEYHYEMDGAIRNSGGQTVDIPAFSGEAVHTWMAFISADGKTLSTSVYAGTVTII